MACSATRGDDGDFGFDPIVCGLQLFGLIGVLLFAAWSATCYVHPHFSVRVQGLEGLDPSRNSTGGMSSAPAFNLAIHVDNKRHIRRVCWEEMAVIAYYNEASDGRYNETSVGWSTLPAFCVDRWSAVDLEVTLPKDGVSLSQRVRDRMAIDRKGAGIKLNVEIKPVDPEDASTACLRLCNTKLGEGPVKVRCEQFC